MRPAHIDKQTVKPHMSAETKRIRTNAPNYIASVINDTEALPDVGSIEELHPHQVSTLGGGADAATYLVRSAGFQVVIKLSYRGVEAEAEALQAWRLRHVRVPAVVSFGKVPATRSQKNTVKYLVQQAFVDESHRVSETAHHYLVHNTNKSRAVGKLLGFELSKIHSTIAKRSFGDFADSQGNTAPYGSWNAYLLGYLKAQEKYLDSIGIAETQLLRIRHFIKRQSYVPKGRYLHGDYSTRNVAVKSYKPLKIGVFDPNPLIGDPSWDLAVMFNNYEFQRRLNEHSSGHADLLHRDQQLLLGLKQGYRRTIYHNRLLTAQLVQAALQASNMDDKVKSGEAEKIEAAVRKELILDLINEIIGRN